MIDSINKLSCTGCKMCADVCPKQAIKFETDIEGFWYPVVDNKKCVSCGICVKKCPNITEKALKTNMPIVKAAWSVDDDIRLASTSGGIFYELAKVVLEQDGYVAGCVYADDYKSAKHVLIHSMDELPPLMVSKYLQSDTANIYRRVLDVLKTGKKVLFVGAPCHIAAMESALDKEYSNLILCDFLCRGANSPKAHKKYVEYLENKYGAPIASLRSKDKRNGWLNFGQSATFANGKEYFASRAEDLRIVAYHYGNLMMRECCNNCNYKTIPRRADITLADFWGINKEEVRDIEKGISLVMINSAKGEEIFEAISDRVDSIDKTLDDAESGNSAIYVSAPKGKNRDLFLKQLDEMPFDQLVNLYRDKKPNIVVRVGRKCKNIVRKIISTIKG